MVVLGVTAALAGYAPATAAQSGPFSGSASLGPTELEVTVDPARVGSNQIHLYLFDAKSGAQFTRVKELDGDRDPAREVDRAAAARTPARRPRPLHGPGRAAQRRRRLASSTSPCASPPSTSTTVGRGADPSEPRCFYLLPALLLLVTLLLRPLPGRAAAARGRRGGAPPDRAAAEPRRLRLARFTARACRAAASCWRSRSPAAAPPPCARRRTRMAPHDKVETRRKDEMKTKICPLALLALALLRPPRRRPTSPCSRAKPPQVPTPCSTCGCRTRATRHTTKVTSSSRQGFGFVSYQPVPGWSVKVVNAKLAKPIETDDGPITEGVREVDLQRRQVAAGGVPGLPALAPDSGQGRRRADLQGGADLRRRRSRALDRRSGLRTPGAAGAGHRGRGRPPRRRRGRKADQRRVRGRERW